MDRIAQLPVSEVMDQFERLLRVCVATGTERHSGRSVSVTISVIKIGNPDAPDPDAKIDDYFGFDVLAYRLPGESLANFQKVVDSASLQIQGATGIDMPMHPFPDTTNQLSYIGPHDAYIPTDVGAKYPRIQYLITNFSAGRFRLSVFTSDANGQHGENVFFNIY